MLDGAGRRAAHRRQEEPRRGVLDLGRRIAGRRRSPRRDAAARPFRRRDRCDARAPVRRLRRRQRHHAAAVDRRHHACRGAGKRIHAVLRQPRVGDRDVPGRARRAEGRLPHALQPGSRAFPRGAGHSAAARSDRSRKGGRIARPLGRSRQGRRRLSLRPGRHDALGRRRAARARLPRARHPDRALRRQHPEARAQDRQALPRPDTPNAK